MHRHMFSTKKQGDKLKKIKKIKIAAYLTIAVLTIAVIYIASIEDRTDKNIEISTETESLDLSKSEGFQDTDSDLTYNYISNPKRLDQIECPLKGSLTLGNCLNEYLQAKNITANELSIIYAETDRVNYTITVMDEDLKQYICIYNISTEQWEIKDCD